MIEALSYSLGVTITRSHNPMKEYDMENPRMEEKDSLATFLDAVDALRSDDESVRTTAHTSSVSSDGWDVSESPKPVQPESAEKSSEN